MVIFGGVFLDFDVLGFFESLFDNFIDWVSARLPASPFKDVSFTLSTIIDSDSIAFLNWLFPLGYMLETFLTFLFALQAYYCIIALLRYLKIIN